MDDYNETIQVSSKIVERFAQTLRKLKYDFEYDVIYLMESYEMIDKEEDKDLLWAIEQVLAFYMTATDFNNWMSSRVILNDKTPRTCGD